MVFHRSLRFITLGVRSAHLAYRVHKRGYKTLIIIIILIIIINKRYQVRRILSYNGIPDCPGCLNVSTILFVCIRLRSWLSLHIMILTIICTILYIMLCVCVYITCFCLDLISRSYESSLSSSSLFHIHNNTIIYIRLYTFVYIPRWIRDDVYQVIRLLHICVYTLTDMWLRSLLSVIKVAVKHQSSHLLLTGWILTSPPNLQ